MEYYLVCKCDIANVSITNNETDLQYIIISVILYFVWYRYIPTRLTEPELATLTHCGLVTTYGDKDLGQHWLG